MSFIKDDGGILAQVVVAHGLTQQHTIGHVFEYGFRSRHIFEANIVADLLSKSYVKLVGYTLGNRHSSDSTWLGATYHFFLHMRLVIVKDKLWYLSGLPRARLPNEDEELGLLVHL